MADNDYLKSQSYLHNDMEWCQTLLLKSNTANNYVGQGGISAVKYNYSNDEKQEVKVWFDNSFTKLFWRNSNRFFSSNIELSGLQGLIFGSFSSTFIKHQDFVLNYDKFKRFAL